MKRKLISIGAVVLALALALTLAPACGKGKEEVKTLKIGVVAPLSGPAAAWGVDLEQGVKWAATKLNEQGGVDIGGDKYMIDVISCDGGMSASESHTCATRLIDDEGIDWIIGPITDHPVEAMIPLFDENKTVDINLSGLIVSPYAFNIGGGAGKYWMLTFYDMMMERYPEIKTVAALVRDDATGLDYGQVELAMDRHNLELVGKKLYAPGTQDFYPYLTPLLAKNPDLLDLSCALPGDAALILKQARELGYTGLIEAMCIGGSAWLMIEVAGAEAAEGLICNGSDYVSDVFPQEAKDLYQEYLRRYNPEGGRMGFVVELGYWSVMFLVQGWQAADSIDTDDFVATVDAADYEFTVCGFTGAKLCGEQEMGINHHIPITINYAEIIGGKLTTLDIELLYNP